MEPLREHEERVEPSGAMPLNYQTAPTDDSGQWKIRSLSPELVARARQPGPRIESPLFFDLEPRRDSRLLPRTDTSFFWEVDGSIVFPDLVPTLREGDLKGFGSLDG
jgi:hypothetical protein